MPESLKELLFQKENLLLKIQRHKLKTQQWLKLTSYCEGDVLNTWLIYIRWLLLKGQLNTEDHRLWIQSTIQYLQLQPQHAEFLNVWRETANKTEFTSFDFPSSQD